MRPVVSLHKRVAGFERNINNTRTERLNDGNPGLEHTDGAVVTEVLGRISRVYMQILGNRTRNEAGNKSISFSTANRSKGVSL